MPYIITTTQSLETDVRGATDTRTAVATLEEMRQKAFGAIDRASKMDRDMNSDEQRADRGFRLAVRFDLDNGGTVGPLPDGTVIEVRYGCGYCTHCGYGGEASAECLHSTS